MANWAESPPSLLRPLARLCVMRTRSTFLLLLALLLSHAQSFAQQSLVDYTALGSPAYAQSLRLSDEQIVQVARILDERRTAVIAAKPEDRPAVFNSANQKLADLLTDKQKRTFQELVSGGRLRFSFREEPWPNVLEWFAGQGGPRARDERVAARRIYLQRCEKPHSIASHRST